MTQAKRTEPRVRITDPRFIYTPAHKTDIRETFKRIIEQKEADKK